MGDLHLTDLLIVVAAAFAVNFALGLTPRLRLPAVVLEIVVGTAVGPSGSAGSTSTSRSRSSPSSASRSSCSPRGSRWSSTSSAAACSG